MNYDGHIRIGTKIDQSGVSTGTKAIGNSLKKLGKLAISAFSVAQVVKFSKASYDAYKTASEAQSKLASYMRTRFNASQEAIQSIFDLTSAEQNLGVVEDDVQKAGLAVLSTFVSTSDELKQLLPSLNNLVASQYGIEATAEDAESIAKAMGKAISSGQVSMLSRMGIAFSDAEEEAFKIANETQRVEMLTKIVKSRVGDINYELAKTDVGRIQQFKNLWGDAKEVLGGVITKVGVLLIPLLNKVLDVVNAIGSKLSEFASALESTFGYFSSGSKKIDSLAESTENAVSAQEDLASAIENTEDVISGSLASFDKLNVLTSSETDDDQPTGLLGSTSSVVIGEETEISSDMKSAMSYISEFIIPLIQRLKDILISAGELIKKIWNEYIKPIFPDLMESVGNALSLINEVIGLVSIVLDTFSPLISGALQNLLDSINSIMGVLRGLVQFVSGVFTGDWQKAFGGLKGAFDSWVDGITSGIANTINAIGGLLEHWGIINDFTKVSATDVKDFIVNTWSSMIDWFAKAGEYMANAFTNAWKSVKQFFIDLWNGIKNIFNTAINGILTGIESFVNFFIRGINFIIDGLNRLSITIPDWVPEVGGKVLGVNIQRVSEVKLPRLAQGAVIPPNKQFMAVLGDQTSGMNIETPLDTMVKAFKTALYDMNGNGSSQTRVDLVLDGRVLARAMMPYNNNINKSYGVNLVIGDVK